MSENVEAAAGESELEFQSERHDDRGDETTKGEPNTVSAGEDRDTASALADKMVELFG